jgi:hypothetical protein
MFEKYLITAKQLARYNNAPLAEERQLRLYLYLSLLT